ncbi:MAG TPA: ethanolamine ammonia-lyase subunit EutB [Jatrophihabitans sp.]|jgi:ethanolamine ammonia-lyase large subunit
MSSYTATVHGERFSFADLRTLLAMANERKSGDELAGIAATSERERVAAKLALADVRLGDFDAAPLVEDEVTEATRAAVGPAAALISSLTVGELRELLLTPAYAAMHAAELKDALLPEVVAAAAKVMGNLDLVVAAAPIRNVTRCRNTMGQPGVLGSRVQPNHPTDDLAAVLISVVDGLLYACGDAVIGINPATDSVERTALLLHGLADLVRTLEIPTQTCVLAHVTTQLRALQDGAPVDLLFQSLAGSEAANRAFGVDLELLREGREAVLASHRERVGDFVGEQCLYIETGQGSALSSEAHHGIDQLTMEARAQGAAKTLDPFLVNTVVGFIGPEYLADSRQITRAGLEDHFVGKVLGLPMGADVCYTNHVDADQNTNDELLALLASAGCNYVMALPAGVDTMLGYQSTSPHDVASVRRLNGLRPAPEFEAWAVERGILVNGGLPLAAVPDAGMIALAERIAAERAPQALGQR